METFKYAMVLPIFVAIYPFAILLHFFGGIYMLLTANGARLKDGRKNRIYGFGMMLGCIVSALYLAAPLAWEFVSGERAKVEDLMVESKENNNV